MKRKSNSSGDAGGGGGFDILNRAIEGFGGFRGGARGEIEEE